MASLNFNLGIEEYELNEKATVRFNPTDMYFIERMFDCIDALDAIQNSIDERVKDVDGVELFREVRAIDKEMRGIIDGLFGEGLSNKCFDGVNVFSYGDGFPVWANLFIALIEEINDAFARENKAATPRMQKYTAKYAKKGHK